MEAEELARLRNLITARYGSVYAYAKDASNLAAAGTARGTLYQILAGRYGGDAEGQTAKLKAALEAPSKAGPAAEPFDILKEAACGRCRRKRPKARQCDQCYELWRAQAAALRERGGV